MYAPSTIQILVSSDPPALQRAVAICWFKGLPWKDTDASSHQASLLQFPVKAEGHRRLLCLPTAGQTLLTLCAPSPFVVGERKEETVMWFYSYPVFSIFLILFLMLILLPS